MYLCNLKWLKINIPKILNKLLVIPKPFESFTCYFKIMLLDFLTFFFTSFVPTFGENKGLCPDWCTAVQSVPGQADACPLTAAERRSSFTKSCLVFFRQWRKVLKREKHVYQHDSPLKVKRGIYWNRILKFARDQTKKVKHWKAFACMSKEAQSWLEFKWINNNKVSQRRKKKKL